MAKAETQKFEELIVEVETDTPGTFTSLCGIIDATITRTNNIDTSEVPDCDDEGAPLVLEREVRSQEVSVTGTGVWARQSAKTFSDWFYSGDTRVVRIRNANITADGQTGDIETETGPAILASLGNERTKGNRVTADIDIQFDGVPVRGFKA